MAAVWNVSTQETWKLINPHSLAGQWHKVSSVQLKPGEAYFTPAISIGKTKPYANVYLTFAHDQQSDEDWVIVSDEPAIPNSTLYGRFSVSYWDWFQ